MKINRILTVQIFFMFLVSLAWAQTSYTFTNANATGSIGPTQLQVNAAYASSNLSGSVIASAGIQQFTVPVTGIYQIIAAGSSGGGTINSFGCRGRIVQGNIQLTAGQILKILVGQKGVSGSTSTGGGGGSYVTTNTNSVIIVGGGGGGYCGILSSSVATSDGNYGNNGLSASGSNPGSGGIAGSGGLGTPTDWGGGGGGFTGNGTAAGSCAGTGGIAFINGGNGGGTCYNSIGGFGGGGGTHGNTGGGGGGGGYSGGGGSGQSSSNNAGGGGGSYQAPNMTNLVNGGLNSGQGYVILTRIAGVSISQISPVLCNGQLTAALSASATGGTAPYTYSWSTGANTQTITGLGSGTYSVWATDAASVVFTATYLVTEPSSIFSLLTQTNVSCNGGNNGAISLTASGGTGPYSYSWSPYGGNSSLATGLTAGAYTCNIFDINACQTSVIVNVSQPAPMNVIAFATSSLVCYGQTSTLLGGGALFYIWSGGVTNGVPFTPTISTNYTVTGTNAVGCSSTAVTSISVNPSPTLGVTGPSVICSGNTAVFTVNGASTYTWSNSSNANTISVTPAVNTSYTVSGTNSLSCTGATVVSLVVINSFPVVTANTNSPVICNGNSTSIYGSGANSYTWSGNISNNVPFTPSISTVYTVTGSNSCGTGTASIFITVNNLPNVTANSSTNAVCIGNTLTLYGGGALTYTWSGGVSNNIAFVPTSTQNYTVIGTDANGCINSASKTVTVNLLPFVTANVSNSVVCLGSSVIFNGGGAQSYNWTGGVIDGVSFFIPTTSSYTVTGTDSNGCQNTAVKSVTVLTVPVVTASASNPAVCAGFTTALTATGAFTYSWSGGISNSVAFVPTVTTTYTVTGSNPCGSSLAFVTVTVNPLPPVIANASSTVICVGNSVILFGSGASTYTWSNGIINNISFSPTTTANYTVQGTDLNGCKNTAIRTIQVNSLPNVTASISNSVICFGNQTTLNAFGAVTYTWSNGIVNGIAFNPSISSTYTVTGTDLNGCQNQAMKTVIVNPLPIVGANSSASVICSGNSLILYGTGANSYTWSGGAVNGQPFYPTNNSSYSVTGTNTITGCTSTNNAVVSVTVNPLPVILTNANPSVVCLGQSTSFNATGANTYTWTNGLQNNVPFVPLVTTNYVVAGTNTLTGCTNLAIQSITVLSLPVVSASASNSVICSGYTTSLFGLGANTYTWSANILNGTAFTPTGTTSYSVIGTNTLTGCTSTNAASILVTVNPLPILQVSATNTNLCQGGTTIFNASGAGTYSWTHGISNGIAFSPSSSTVYTLTGLSPLTGCVNTATLFVLVNPVPSLSIQANTNSVCVGNTVQLNAQGADTYTWSGGIINGVAFVPSISTTYSVNGTFTLTGCSSTLSANQTISVYPRPNVTASSSSSSVCFGGQVVLSGGGANTYTWSGGITNGLSFTPSTTASYTVIGTSTLTGCSSTNVAVQTVSVIELPILNLSANSTLICAGETTSLYVNGANTYTWNSTVTGNSIFISPGSTTAYTVSGTSSLGCVNSAVITVSVSDCTSLNYSSMSGNSIKVFPNPNNGEFRVETDFDAELILLNELGIKLFEFSLLAGRPYDHISGDELPNGIYFVINKSGTPEIRKKIVISK